MAGWGQKLFREPVVEQRVDQATITYRVSISPDPSSDEESQPAKRTKPETCDWCSERKSPTSFTSCAHTVTSVPGSTATSMPSSSAMSVPASLDAILQAPWRQQVTSVPVDTALSDSPALTAPASSAVSVLVNPSLPAPASSLHQAILQAPWRQEEDSQSSDEDAAEDEELVPIKNRILDAAARHKMPPPMQPARLFQRTVDAAGNPGAGDIVQIYMNGAWVNKPHVERKV